MAQKHLSVKVRKMRKMISKKKKKKKIIKGIGEFLFRYSCPMTNVPGRLFVEGPILETRKKKSNRSLCVKSVFK